MSINSGNTSSKYGKIILLVTFLVIALPEMSNAQRRIDCRKFVFAPPCRGIAAKRDTQSRATTIRFTPPEYNNYILDNQKLPSSENFENMNGLIGLLKKSISKNVDYDTGTNYLA